MGSSDDAWLEAELERELLQTDVASDTEDEDDDNLARLVAERRQHQAEEESQGDTTERLPESFKELIASLQEWGDSAANEADQGVKEALQEADSLERELKEPPAPPLMPLAPAEPEPTPLPDFDLDFEEEASEKDGQEKADAAELSDDAAELPEISAPDADPMEMLARLAEEARREARAQVEAKKGPEEDIGHGIRQPLDRGEQAQESVSELDAEAPRPAAEETVAQDPVASSELYEDATEEDAVPEEAEAADSMKELQQRIEDERLSCLAELEKQREAYLLQMKKEDDARREEQARLREEIAMHSEELWAKEFYQSERNFQRREWRAMAAADRLSSQMRDEERKLIADAQRRQEASESRAMAREDALSQAVRRRERELWETKAFAAEDAKSRAFNIALRLAEEAKRFAAADAESYRWRDVTKEAAESLQMGAEDRLAAMCRLCTVPGKAKAVSDEAREQPSLRSRLGLATVAEAPREVATVLANLAPLQGSATRSAAAPSMEDIGSSNSSSCVPTVMVDPWESFPEPPKPSSSSPPPAAEERCSEICAKLLEGNARWRGRAPPRRRRLAAHPSPAPQDPPKRSTGSKRGAEEELGFDSLTGFDDLCGGSASGLVRLELRMEGLERLPDLSQAAQLRVLVLSGNKICGDLDALRHCPNLEELGLCQNALTSLDGLRFLPQLSVLKATMNEITDADDLAKLPALRVVDLSKNRINSAPLRASGLAKLVLYRNSLDSTTFLQHLPSLTELDLGRNKLTELDPRISEWNPFLIKVFLYENRLAVLPEMRLPLLTDLWVDNNVLDSLGPLGFLPSLERLQAKHNQIRTLSSPLAASPHLQTLELAFNQLAVSEPPKAVLSLPRLKQLQLNDNPAATDLMEGYRPWVLQMAPQLEELDNETVSETERLAAAVKKSIGDLSLAQELAWAKPRQAAAEKTAEACKQAPVHSPGLLGLVEVPKVEGGARSEDGFGDRQSEGIFTVTGPFAFSCSELQELRRASVIGRWRAAWEGAQGPQKKGGGCQMCALASWCEALTAARSAPLVAHMREERRSATSLANFSGSSAHAKAEALFVLRRRRDFWTAFLDLCGAQHDSLSPWVATESLVCRTAAFELPLPGTERSRQLLIRAVQARWRGVLGRKRCRQMRLEQLCEALPQEERRKLTHVQAVWRGKASRQRLRSSGMVLPGDRRQETYKLATIKLQAALRGSRVRRKLKWAREMSKMVNDDLEELPEVDIGDLLGEAQELAIADPFSQLRLPVGPAAAQPSTAGVVSARESRRSSQIPAAAPVDNVQPTTSAVPMVAWSTPPATALPTATQGPPSARHEGWDGGSAASSPSSSRPNSGIGGPIPRRSRSMSSTAESAITEPDGQVRTPSSKVDRAKDEWGFEDSETAKRYLAAQRHRVGKKPPALPGHSTTKGPSSSSRTGSGTPVARSQKGSSSSKSLGPRGAGGGSCVKAQDAIAEFRRQQDEADREAAGSPTLEFRSGEPNLKLMRSSKGLQGLGQAGSPRARSPLHNLNG